MQSLCYGSCGRTRSDPRDQRCDPRDDPRDGFASGSFDSAWNSFRLPIMGGRQRKGKVAPFSFVMIALLGLSGVFRRDDLATVLGSEGRQCSWWWDDDPTCSYGLVPVSVCTGERVTPVTVPSRDSLNVRVAPGIDSHTTVYSSNHSPGPSIPGTKMPQSAKQLNCG